MKYQIISDIHGSLPRLDEALAYFRSHNMDMLIILGDILNYGPRNGVPEGLDAQGIAERLNAMADKVIAIRGNCDSEVDQMLLHFPMMSDYAILVDEGKRFFLTHGHIYNKEKHPVGGFEVMLHGHTHMQGISREEGFVLCNTGSITFPKGGNPPTFATYKSGILRMHQLDGKVIAEEIIK